MNEKREGHGCVMSTYNGSDSVFVVGGRKGVGGNDDLNTMEIYNSKQKKWVLQTSKLPFPLEGLQVIHATFPGYHVYVAGGDRRRLGTTSAIYGFTTNNEWKMIGNLTFKRYRHVSLNIPLEHIPGYQFFFPISICGVHRMIV